ncbi:MULTISPECIES: flagellar hook-length control protein FliK [Curtobacterium]|uniref:flagellar hook-length control protein FliK n=1 Tax=Curtobacterium TaxID=2034 RepID=UPI0006FC6B5E|nr:MULTISPECIES: flagellar hook-length control protein FliK [Curtobacterium]KQR34580.1 hypothetical protein ASF75_01995 [Curtobacterium sp. Leaf154]MBT1618569.1 flagellar hook-length control protein FliK [Curtobacterium flaccumfaciens pv. poinsettiae]MCU0154192.1 flagellar hook-length control protein FliK [Curtobacterium flaccumfaciens pv. poinsettiae]MDQ0538548.1 flagellar hook-length control protein FliK [Curtobacterium flaccumfaciens]TPG09055.1 flagellar hook-length control protein FliK [Cu
MSLTIATQPSVPTAPSPTRGAASDPAAAGSFGAALTAAVATERRAGDGAAERDDTEGRTADGSAATPSTAVTPSASTSTSTSDRSVPATDPTSVDAQSLLAVGLTATPAAPAAPAAVATSTTAGQAAVRTGEPSVAGPHATDGTAAIPTTTPKPVPVPAADTASQTSSAPTPTSGTASVAPQQAPATAPAVPAVTATAPSAPAVPPRGTASPAAASEAAPGTAPAPTAVAGATVAVPAAAIPAAAPTRTDEATSTGTPAPLPAVAAGAAPAAGTGSRAGHGTQQQASTPGDPGLPAVVPSRGGETPFVMSTTPTAAPAAATAPAPAPLAQQLARPVFTLAQAGPGEHVVTVQVVPDSLGPVTVRAHVTAHGMHVELFAASDAGREAVRQVLPDLRRDAGGTGVSTTLDLSSQNQPQDAPGRDERPAARVLPGDPGLEARGTPRTQPATHTPSIRTAGLDVLA